MEADEKVRWAQDIINWAILELHASIKGTVTRYKHDNFSVQFCSKDDKLIMHTQISEAWIKATNPTDKVVSDQLKLLITNLQNY